jgi:hypothetical protein
MVKNGSNGNNGDRNLPGTHLVIPYYTDPFWMCTSILIDEGPHAGQKLTSGQTASLSLDAVNRGDLTTPATCLFYWANPTIVFTGRRST